MTWISPVCTRTAEDVANKTPKGVLNASDLTRIEGNTAYLAAYFGLSLPSYTSWQAGSLIFERDMQRIAGGVAALRAHSGALHPCPQNPHWLPACPTPPLNHWQQFNLLETLHLRILRAAQGGEAAFTLLGENTLGDGGLLG